jgi:DNA polymerase III subunit gamma/tau
VSYVVLARKWRPAQFADIVGQGHIVRTLMNAIRAQRIHPAYLFTGSRGIGKTSIARIFAKVIRCENTTGASSNDEWLKSCDACASCREIASGNSVEVIEIDGASNNGVDHVRDLRENVKYLPSTGARKIYIIDEVHMLSTAAFNALLKTLEEPPAHVIFIFATTEPHKIPGTIHSRCQRFDFRRVTVAQIQMRLAEVVKAEGIEAEAGALALIARAAEGSMRDALSLLDQVIAFSGESITTHSVRESVGLIGGSTLLGIINAMFSRKPLDALALVEDAYRSGHDLRILTRSLIEFLHGAILAKVGAPNSATLELSEDEWLELKQYAQLRSLEEIELIFQVLHHGLEWIARSPQPQAVLDVLLIKCATSDALIRLYDQTNTASNIQAPATSPKPVQPAPAKTATASAIPSPAIIPVAPTPKPTSWEGFIDFVRQTRPALASVLEHGICSESPGPGQDSLKICFLPEHEINLKQAQGRVYHEMLQSLSKDYYDRAIRVRTELAGAEQQNTESLAARKERELREKEKVARDAVLTHPIIQEARSLFGGELGPIELPLEADKTGSGTSRA